MNRRELLKYLAAGVATCTLPNISIAKEYSFFNKNQLLRLFKQIDASKGLKEIIRMNNLKEWNGSTLKPHEAIHIAIMRISNLMHRRTLDNQSQHWIAVDESMTKHDLWYKFQFCKYSTPGQEGGTWEPKPWQYFIKNEIAPGVFNIGNLCGKWDFYVCPGLPKNKILCGMGYKQVVHFRQEGTIQYDWDIPNEYPNLVPYMDKPTLKNYAVINLEN